MMGNEKETVSIIMAAYNAEKTIGAAIRSVLAQTYPDWELLVINDASGDRTVEIVSRTDTSSTRATASPSRTS